MNYLINSIENILLKDSFSLKNYILSDILNKSIFYLTNKYPKIQFRLFIINDYIIDEDTIIHEKLNIHRHNFFVKINKNIYLDSNYNIDLSNIDTNDIIIIEYLGNF